MSKFGVMVMGPAGAGKVRDHENIPHEQHHLLVRTIYRCASRRNAQSGVDCYSQR